MITLSALLLLQVMVLVLIGNVVLAAGYLRSLVALIGAFLLSAMVWIMVGADFLGLILVLVYVGAVLVLFLFVLMMLRVEALLPDSRSPANATGLGYYSLFVLSAWVFASLAIGSETWSGSLSLTPMKSELDSIRAVGMLLYRDYAVAFVASSLVLTTAAVAAIYLTREPWELSLETASERSDARDAGRDPADGSSVVAAGKGSP